MTLSTHVLDTALGAPAAGLEVTLSILGPEGLCHVATHFTDASGRVANLLAESSAELASYQLKFDTETYFARTDRVGFYPYVEVTFRVSNVEQHYHVPLLLSPFGYSTYRGC